MPSWIRPPRHKWPKSWSSMEDPVVPLERNLFLHREKGLFISVYVDDIKLAGKKQNLDQKKSIWENQHLSLIMCTWAALKDNVK